MAININEGMYLLHSTSYHIFSRFPASVKGPCFCRFPDKEHNNNDLVLLEQSSFLRP